MRRWLYLVPLLVLLPVVAHAQGTVTGGSPDAFLTNILAKFMTAIRSGQQYATVGASPISIALLGWVTSSAAAQIALRFTPGQIVWYWCAGIAYYIISFNAASLTSFVANWLSNLVVVDSGASGGILANPSLLISHAFEVTQHLVDFGTPDADASSLDKLKALPGVVGALVTQLPAVFMCVFIVIGFAATAIIGMKAVVWANIKIMIGTALTCCLILPTTRSVGMFGVSLILNACVELAAKSILVGVGYQVLNGISLTADSNFQAVLEVAVAGIAVAWMCLDTVEAVNLARGRF